MKLHGADVTFRLNRLYGRARPTFFYCRTKPRNPLDRRIFRVGPFQVRW